MRTIALAAGLLLAGGHAAAQTDAPGDAQPAPAPETTPAPAPTPAARSGARADTKGGLTVTSDDGAYEFKLGGRVHFDSVSIDSDDSPAYSEFGGSYFRRARLTLSGKAAGWEFKFENDFADNEAATSVDCDDSVSPPDCEGATVGTTSFREAWLGRSVPYLPGGFVTIGQFKPLRGMEELTSSNEITMIERPFASASGLWSGRQWAMGVKVGGEGDSYTYGAALQTTSTVKAADTRMSEEPVITGRVTWAPIKKDGMVAHLGLSAGMENGHPDAPGARLRGRGKLPGTDVGTSRTLAEAGAATNATDKDATHAGLELAGAFSVATIQAEYVTSSYTDAYDDSNGDATDATVTAGYVMASVFVTGESKTYKSGVFRSPKPKRGNLGAVELKARYDFAKNEDQPATDTNEREISVMTVGANWYPNANVRFMLEYSMADDRTTQVDGEFVRPTAVTLRSQFHF